MVFKAQTTAAITATIATIQKTARINPITKWTTSAATAISTNPANARFKIGGRERPRSI